MTDSDLPRFQTLLKRVCATFRIRTDNDDFKLLAQSYFSALRQRSFDDLERGADAWMSGQTKFPKPIEWKQAIPRPRIELPPLGMSEAREYTRAELNGWEDDHCSCKRCVEAGVTEKRLRFVPDFNDDEREMQATHPNRGLVITRGHLAHGLELARWYEARADFYNRYFAVVGSLQTAHTNQRRPFIERIEETLSAPRKKHSEFVHTTELL